MSQSKQNERAELGGIHLKWAKIARAKAKEDFSLQNGASADPMSRYELDGIPPPYPITVCLDVSPSEVELALATNGASLRRATLTALVAAMVVDDVVATTARA